MKLQLLKMEYLHHSKDVSYTFLFNKSYTFPLFNLQPEQKANILLVDDQPENLLALEAILERLGQNLVKAHSGQEALRCLLNQDFAVILLDVQMPDLDGLETARLIQERQRSQGIPIIFLTAFSTSETLVFKSYSLGAVDFVFKPISPEILLSKVAVFVTLFKKMVQVKQQAAQLEIVNAELRKKEEQFLSLSACSPVGIFMIDVADRFTYTNSHCLATCSFRLGESAKEGWSRLVHPGDRDWVLVDWLTFTSQAQEYSNEFRLITQPETVRWVHVRSSPVLSDEGELFGHVATVEDISERKQAEVALRQGRDQLETRVAERTTELRNVNKQLRIEIAERERAESSLKKSVEELAKLNGIKDDFLSTVSHELRTPITNMKLAIQMLKTAPDPQRQQQYLEILQVECMRESNLINDLLDLQRLESTSYSIELKAVNLRDWLPDIIEPFRSRTLECQQTLQVNLFPDLQPLISDCASLGRILAELLNNACKYTAAGGKITLSISHESDAPTMNGSSTPVTIFAIHNSAEIPAHELPRIFEKFYRVPNTDRWKQGGTGLGLALVQKLVEQLQGKILVESSGGWTNFTVQLPNQPVSQ